LQQRVVALEEENADLQLRLEELEQELQAARDSNRELMSALNSRR
jgi:cell division septum initiation protein DivIVA